MIIPKHYENMDILHENTMPNRCYYIPASKVMHTLVENREQSDRMMLLNGQWKFKYYDSILDVQEQFYEKDYDVNEYDTVSVPGTWQMAGYDAHQYTNIHYPFPFDPPYVPQDNPCGTYVHEFEYRRCEEAPKAYLTFEGVDSCFHVWVNGDYVGYSQVSHATSEFDITDNLVDGKNRLAVLVLKWCDGSYLEDQDKFRMSGIFRDVYILKRPEKVLYDYFIKTRHNDNKATVSVELTWFGEKIPTKVSLYEKNGVCIASREVADKDRIELDIINPLLWCPEDPYLYTIIFETANEVITDRVGVREIHIDNTRVIFNGQPIIFKGVNRHDSDPETGFVISIDQMKKDMEMMKQHNFNAIRSSHYPNAPQFYQLCDEYGFLVVDEADNESHGPCEVYYADDNFENKSARWNETIADNKAFIEATVDRVRLMVEREKNRPCIVIWSMGNECAYGCTFEEALKWTKTFDDTRLTHFESARYRSNKRKYDFSNLDLYSRMYPPFKEIQDHLDGNLDGAPDKPFILIEYCHAMGNGPGDFEDYFQIFHKEDIMCGGFVWEWCDHAIAHGKAEDGRTKYFYGGDHGEDVHDSNFCMDGLVYPDRRPHTGLLEYKNVYRPLRVVDVDQKDILTFITFHNYLDFTNAHNSIGIRYELSCDGEIIDEGEIETPWIEPHGESEVMLPLMVPEKGKVYLKMKYYSAKDVPLVPKGHELGFDEILLENKEGKNQKAAKLSESFGKSYKAMSVKETNKEVVVTGSQFTYVLDKRTGLFTKLEFDGKDQIEKPMEVNIWRAPTDNDMYIKAEWLRAKFNQTKVRTYNVDVQKVEEKVSKVIIKCTMSMAANAVQKMLDIDTTWTIDADGAIALSMKVKRCPEFPMLPRFGLRLFLDKEMEQVEYYGMGPVESYVDKHRASSHGVYTSDVKDMHEDYIRPQENGSHYDCSYVTLESDKYVLNAVSEKEFSFNASVYTQEELAAKKHNFELEESGNTVLCLDYAQSGIGSNSCGPELSPQYRVDEKEFLFDLKLIFEEK